MNSTTALPELPTPIPHNIIIHHSALYAGGYSLIEILQIVQCATGGLMFTTNVIFLIVLAFGRWRLHRPKRYALSANLALADAICGLVLMALGLIVLFDWYGGSMINLLLETTMSASFVMCTLCYDAILRVQYVAVTRPVRYFLYLTMSKLFCIVALIWTAAHALAFAKGYVLFFQSTTYAYYLTMSELATMGVAWLINFIAFIFVIVVANKKVRAERVKLYQSRTKQSAATRLLKKVDQTSPEGPATAATGSAAADGTTAVSVTLEDPDEEPPDPRYCGSPQSEHAFVITVGLNLFIFFLSYVPLWVNCVMSLYWGQEVYFEQRNKVTRHLLLLVCFVRGIFDPVVHLLRQPKLVCGDQYRDSRD